MFIFLYLLFSGYTEFL